MIENQQILNSFEHLRFYIKKWTENPNYKDGDIRNMFINQIDRILIYHNLNFHYFIRILQNKNDFDKILETETIEDHYSILETYQTQAKNALIFQLSSILERFLRVILRYFKPDTNSNKQFYAVREEVFDLFHFDKNDEWKAISILSNIRNTFHNNGIHTSDDISSITYRERNYSFVKNELHSNADYYTLFMITQDIIRLYGNICNSSLSQENDLILG